MLRINYHLKSSVLDGCGQAVVRVDLAALGTQDDDGSADNIIASAGGPSTGDSKLKAASGQTAAVTFNRVRLVLEYERAPRLWTVDVADTSTADGYGTPDVEGRDTSFSETQVKCLETVQSVYMYYRCISIQVTAYVKLWLSFHCQVSLVIATPTLCTRCDQE